MKIKKNICVMKTYLIINMGTQHIYFINENKKKYMCYENIFNNKYGYSTYIFY